MDPENQVTLDPKDLTKTTEILKAVHDDLANIKDGYLSKDEFLGKFTPLITEIMEEHKKEHHKQESKMIFPGNVASTDLCLMQMKSAMSIQDPKTRDLAMQDSMSIPTKNEQVKEFKGVCDSLVLIDAIMSPSKRYRGIESLKTYGRFQNMRDDMFKAIAPMDTGDTANWIPTGMSSEMIDMPEIYGQVEPLFRRITCPTGTYTYPINITPPTTLGNYVAETTTSTNPFDDTDGQEMTDEKLTFVAKKIRARLITSGELSEDAIIPLIPELKQELKRIQDRTVESCILNGDTAGTHMDSDVTDAKDGRKAWDGLRDLLYNAGSGELRQDLTTWNAANFRAVRGVMGKYGVYPSQLAWIIGIKAYLKHVLALDDVRTVDKYGINAVVLKGELAKFDGIPIILSEHQREDLNDSCVYDGVTAKACLMCVNRDMWFIGDRRMITVEGERWLNTDQINLVSFRRLHFIPFMAPSATYTIGGIGWKLAV